MAKARRPVFRPSVSGYPFVDETYYEFTWFSGFSLNQARKSVVSLHEQAYLLGISPVLEISTKSDNPLGVALSAFNLRVSLRGGRSIPLECAYQGSKVFQAGGPYSDLFEVKAYEAKKDARLRQSGELERFEFEGESFGLRPATLFYDWLYINALCSVPALASRLLEFNGFTDIAFNPAKSMSCQARSAALFVALTRANLLENAVRNAQNFVEIMGLPDSSNPSQLSLF